MAIISPALWLPSGFSDDSASIGRERNCPCNVPRIIGATAQTRRDLLERLIPRLKIAGRCTLQDRFLLVRGDRRTYKIHLGSGNILMEPNDQYLCIVPARGGPEGSLFLPFEGDRMLSVILSKAFLLADDTKISDPTILSQIRM